MKSALFFFALFCESLGKFTPESQKEIVEVHNNLRSSIALGTFTANGTKKAPAANMIKMKWNSTCASAAQKFANICPTGHSDDAPMMNLYWFSMIGAPIGELQKHGKLAALAFANEFQTYGWPSNHFDLAVAHSGIGHATMMAWAEASMIGCGIKDCGKDAKQKNKETLVVACQYWPGGNIFSQDIYKEGAACSACPSGTSCEKSTGLCDSPNSGSESGDGYLPDDAHLTTVGWISIIALCIIAF